jgi:hypothetical protein
LALVDDPWESAALLPLRGTPPETPVPETPVPESPAPAPEVDANGEELPLPVPRPVPVLVPAPAAVEDEPGTVVRVTALGLPWLLQRGAWPKPPPVEPGPL